MQKTIKLMAIVLATSLSSTMMWADPIEAFEVEFKYDRTEPAAETYERAKRIARKACDLKSRQLAVKRAQKKICVAPLVEQIVIKSGDDLVLALHIEETGHSPQQLLFVER